MSYVRSQAIFPFFTLAPRDVFINTMHWLWDDVTLDREEVADEIALRLGTFYDTIYGTAGMASYITVGAATVECLYMIDPSPRVPEVRPLTTSIGEITSNVPTEVSICASYHAAPESGVQRQRLHNRIYLGALVPTMMTGSSDTTFPGISSGIITIINTAMQGLLNSNSAGLEWRQHSAAGGIDTLREIAGGWTDNSPDTQRRRTVVATTRNVWLPA